MESVDSPGKTKIFNIMENNCSIIKEDKSDSKFEEEGKIKYLFYNYKLFIYYFIYLIINHIKKIVSVIKNNFKVKLSLLILY